MPRGGGRDFMISGGQTAVGTHVPFRNGDQRGASCRGRGAGTPEGLPNPCPVPEKWSGNVLPVWGRAVQGRFRGGKTASR